MKKLIMIIVLFLVLVPTISNAEWLYIHTMNGRINWKVKTCTPKQVYIENEDTILQFELPDKGELILVNMSSALAIYCER
jgi:hypothetical protein